MAANEGKKKKPPTFHYLPKSRARQLKKSWIEDHKIRSKWKAQKKREGLTNKTSVPVEDSSDHRHDKTTPDSASDTSMNRPNKSPSPSPSPPHDERSLRDPRRIAYASIPLRSQKADSSRQERAPEFSHNGRGGKPTVGRETGQPNMKLRMNVLLEKIKRDFS